MIVPKQVVFLILFAGLWTPRLAVAQASDQKLTDRMLDCTMYETGGPWVDAGLRRDGLLRFSYLHEMPKAKPDPEDDHFQSADNLYAAFWNPSNTKANFLHFTLRKIKGRNWLTISNVGWISFSKGKIDFEIFQGGVWTYDHYMVRVKKLVRAPIQTAFIPAIKRTGALCDSLTHPVLNEQTRPSEKK